MKNQQLQTLIRELKTASIEHKAPLWKRLASELEGPTAKRRVVNLSKINKYSKDNEIVIVPGKVLSMGDITKKVTIAAYNFSSGALIKINASGAKAVSLNEILKKDPKGAKVRIIG
jgi:large subunit ribosomal protein L18e